MKLKDMIITCILGAILIVSQVALSALPNIEIVSCLIIIYTIHFKSKALISIYIFAFVEFLIYGFSIWNITYLYIWLILWGITMLFRKNKSVIIWAVICAMYGLLYGTLCSIPSFIMLGPAGALSWIANGLLFDLYHMAGNLIITLILFKPLNMLFDKILDKYYNDNI